MKKRCEVAFVFLELSIHEFVSLFSRKRVDELKNKLVAFKNRMKTLLTEPRRAFSGSLHENDVRVIIKKECFT